MKVKKYFLIFAFFVVSAVALLYGASPEWFAATFLSVDKLDTNLAHILRAIAGLYLALGLFWLCAAFSDTHRDMAVLTTIIFAAGLVIGRIVSLFADGRPSPILLLYVVMELVLVPVAYVVYRLPD